MNCPSCNEINPEDSIFCGNCGNSLESDLICPECGEANPQDSIYCAECGSLYKPSLEVPPQITIGEPENTNLNTNRSQRSLLIIGGIIVAMVVVVFTLTLRPTEIDKAEVIKEVPIQIEVIREVEVIKEVPVEVEVIREVEVTKEVPVEVEVIREVEVVKEIPVENLNADIDKEAETKEKHQRYSISSNPTRPLSQTYHDYEIGFSISYPEQWDLVEQNERDLPEWVIPDIEVRNPHGGFIRIEGQKMEGVTLRNFTSDRITNDRNFVAETTEHIEKIP
ncbi:MAG: zinc ribbon domain-containing protein, partial [Chloroflexota bacterium]|nr:zinc ribbon domain-containing protein [Chloroflexota bacterium]